MLVARLPGFAQSSIVDLSLTEIKPKMILGTDSLALEYRIGFNDKMNLGRVHFFTFYLSSLIWRLILSMI